MEEISEAALAYYENGSEEQKQLARDFFNSLDEDGNGTVDVHEFIKILSEEGHGLVNNSGFFQELDRDGNESLDFNEFLTLFYIIKSRSRPFCAGCGIFLKSLFFSCAKCHESSDETFDLCSACYRGKRFSHQHAAFLDNYTLLAHKRLITLGGKGQPNTSQAASSGTSSSNPKPPESKSATSSQSSSSAKPQKPQTKTSARPNPKQEKRRQRLEAFNNGIDMGNYVSDVVTGDCSIL
ncbi:hypothetical protein VitviT2T_006814 [Vitis vinifera]|uniref:EF-hand domain-containing protein n=1 Tax=Vitis vinifera TaxID=29760 RepID=A0ABY9BX59_VITVI|nr:uncharacterized protein LOC100252791 [Vitis vinifera]WJZ87435.1 hypothetical protein VitviT2T_006814 [Vitis vinifera]|eukprot:XP_019075484.1 PREDICTED: uncharacterized protein LOC100252791 [Vitis vinifera]